MVNAQNETILVKRAMVIPTNAYHAKIPLFLTMASVNGAKILALHVKELRHTAHHVENKTNMQRMVNAKHAKTYVINA